jgi:hypothetical protein
MNEINIKCVVKTKRKTYEISYLEFFAFFFISCSNLEFQKNIKNYVFPSAPHKKTIK